MDSASNSYASLVEPETKTSPAAFASSTPQGEDPVLQYPGPSTPRPSDSDSDEEGGVSLEGYPRAYN